MIADQDLVHAGGLGAFEQAFGVKIVQAKRDVAVYALTAPNGKPAGLKEPKAGESGSGTSMVGYTFRKSTMDDLAELLKEELKGPVFNETKIEGEFAFDLAGARPNNGPSHEEAVKKLGLSLKKENRPMDWLVVEKGGK